MQHVVFCFCDNLINVWDYFVGAAAWQSQWVSYSGLILSDKIQFNLLKKKFPLFNLVKKEIQSGKNQTNSF